MKLPLLATRLGILAFKLMVAAIVILSVLPFIMGDIGVDLNSEDEGDWSFDGSTVRMEVPFAVRNDGFFDINDLLVSFTFMDQEGVVLAVSEGDPVDIPAGRETDVDIELALDLYDFDQPTRSDLIFNGTEIYFDAAISAKYTWDMVRLSVTVGSDMGWDALIRDLQVEEWGANAYEDGEDRYVRVPFSFQASDMLNGQPVAALTEYWDESGYYANVTQEVVLSQNVNENALLSISQEAYGRLMNGTANATVRTTLIFLDCSTFDEGHLNIGGGGGGGGDPILNLELHPEMSYLQDMGGSYYISIPFSYSTDPSHQGQYANAYIEYWDSHGFNSSIYQMVYLVDYGWQEVQIWLSPEAYQTVFDSDEVVHFSVTMSYQSWTGFDERTYYEQWGWSP